MSESNISCQNYNDFSGAKNEQYRLGEGSCIYVNFREESVEDGKTFGKYLSGAPGSIQLDNGDYYVVPRDNNVTATYAQDWVIRKRTGRSPVEKLGSREYHYKDTDGSDATAIAARGDFQYASVLDMRDMEASYYYTDALFTNSNGNGALDYDQHLATMSCVLAMSAFRRPYTGAENQARNVKNLMTDLGMKSIEINYPEPARNDFNDYTIGYAIGQKKLTEGSNAGKTLITIAVRGANYMTEWGSNTTLQNSGVYNRQSAGFSDAADKVTKGVQKYLSKNRIDGSSSDVIYWITGYSRGGATANLTAQRITDLYNDGNNGDGNRVYAYPIEAPQGAWFDAGTGKMREGANPKKANPKDYKNIHNIINPDDLVPRVAPSVMGFSRFGVDHLIPGKTTLSDNRDGDEWRYRSHNDNGSNDRYKETRIKMIEQLATLDPRIGFSDKFQISTMKFLRNTITNADMINKNGKLVAPQDWYDGFLKNLINFGLAVNPAAGYPDTIDPQTGKKRATPLTDEKEIAQAYRFVYTMWNGVRFDPASGVGLLELDTNYNSKMDTRVDFQEAIEKVIVLVFGLDKEKSDALTKNLAKCAVELDKGFKCSDGSTLKMRTLYTDDIIDWVARSTSSKNKRIKELWELVQVAQLDKILTKQQYDDLRTVFPVLVEFAMNSVCWDWRKNSSGLLGTLLANTETLAQAHYPEVNFAWLRAQDDFFDKDGTDVYVGRKIPLDPVSEPQARVTGIAEGDIIPPGDNGNQYVTYNSQDGVLEMSTNTEGAKILYTLNGEKPTLDGYGVHVYEGSFKLYSESDHKTEYDIRMVAYKDGVYSPESSIRFDVYPGSLTYNLTIQYGDGRTKTQKEKPGTHVFVTGAPKYQDYSFKRWHLMTVPSVTTDIDDKFDEKKEEAEKKIFRDGKVNSAQTVVVMPGYDVVIAAEYNKSIKGIYLQFDQSKKVKPTDKIEWAVDNGEKRFCSPGFTPLAGTNKQDYTVVNAYLSCSEDELVRLYGSDQARRLTFFFDPRKVDKQLPLIWTGVGTGKGNLGLDIYLNGALAPKVKSQEYTGEILSSYVSGDNGAVSIQLLFSHPIYDEENTKKGRMEITASNGMPKEEILKKLPGYTTLTANHGRLSYVVKMNWDTAPLNKYDPTSKAAQDIRIKGTPDVGDFNSRYPESEYPGANNVLSWFVNLEPRCDIHIIEAPTLASPVVEADRQTYDSLNAPKIKIKYEGSTEGVTNLRLSYTTDFGKTFIPYTADSEVDLSQYIDRNKKTFTLGVKASSDNCKDSTVRYYKYNADTTVTRKVTLVNLGPRNALLNLPQSDITYNGFTQNAKRHDGYFASVKPGETVEFYSYSHLYTTENIGDIKKITYKYGNSTHTEEPEQTFDGIGLHPSFTTDTRTRYEDGTSRDLTIIGHYDYSVEQFAVDLDAEGKITKISAKRRGESGDTALNVLDPEFYTVKYTDNKNIIDVRLRGGDGYIWSDKMKNVGDVEIESVRVSDLGMGYGLRICVADAGKLYTAGQYSSIDNTINKDAYSKFAKRGDTVTLEAPEVKGAKFSRWKVVYPEGLAIADVNAAKTTYIMPGKNVKIEAEYVSYKNIDNISLTIPKALPYNDLPEGSVSVNDGNIVKAEWAGWQTSNFGFNDEVRAAVKLVPQNEYEFRKMGGDTAVNVNTKFTVSAGDLTGEVVKADILDDGSVLAIVSQTTAKGMVSAVSWGSTELSVSENALPDPTADDFNEALLELIPKKVTVSCTNPKEGGATVPFELAVTGQVKPFDPTIANDFSVTSTIGDTDKLDLSSVTKTCEYTIHLVPEPLDVKSIEWGETELKVPYATTAQTAVSYIPDEVWVSFERNDSQINMSIPVKKECTGESGSFTVTATLDIEVDQDGTKGYTDSGNVPLTQTYTLTVPDYHKVNVTRGTAEGFPGRDFDTPEWSWITEGEQGELKYVEKNDTVFVSALNRDGYRFEHWDAEGITLSDTDKRSPVIDFNMAEGDVSLTALYDEEITNISAKVNADRTEVLSVTVNDTVTLAPEDYTATITGDRISVSLVPGRGRYIGDDTELKKDDLLIQALFKKDDYYSVDLMMWPVDLMVTIECVDDEGNDITDSDTVIVGIFAKNDKVTADYPDLKNYEFKEWRTRNKDLIITTDTNKLVTFTMPEEKVVLEAVYEPYDKIDFVTLEIPEPKRGKALPSASIKADPDGGELNDEKTEITWYFSDGISASDAPERVPDYGETVHALVRLEPDKTSRFITEEDYDDDGDEEDDEYTDDDLNVYTAFMLVDGDTLKEIDDVYLSSDGSVLLYIDYRMDKRLLSSVNWGNTEFNGRTVTGNNLDMSILPNMAELKFSDSSAGEEPVMRPIKWPVYSTGGEPVEGIVRTETDDAITFSITGTVDIEGDIDSEAYYDEEEDTDDEEDTDSDSYEAWLDPGSVALSKVYTVTLVKEPKPEKPYISFVTDDNTDRIKVSFIANVNKTCDIYYNYVLEEGDDEPEVADPTRTSSLGKITYNPAVATGNSITVDIPESYKGKDLNFRIKAITDIDSESEQGVKISSKVADESTEIYVPGDRKLTVSMSDVNNVPCYETYYDGEGREMTRASVVYDELGGGSTVLLIAPSTKNESFYRWEIPSDVSVEYVQSVYYADDYDGEKEEERLIEDSTGLSGKKGYTNQMISVKMPANGDLDITARYKPVVSSISIDVEEPEANAEAPTRLDKLTFRISDEYMVDDSNILVEWSGTEDFDSEESGKALKFDEESDDYELVVSLIPDKGTNKIKIKKSDGNVIQYDASDIRFADDVEVIVNGNDPDSTLDIAYAEDAFDENDEPYVCCVFENMNKPDDRRDGPDAATVIAECIDNVTGTYTDTSGQYEYAFDKKTVESDWKADISAHAGETMYVRYKADDDQYESKWTEIKLPERNGSLPEVGIDFLYDKIYFEGVDKWQYRLDGEEEWRIASTADMSPEEFGWDGSRIFFTARQPGDSTHFPGENRQVELAARPAAPEDLKFTDNSAELRGSVIGTFKYAAGTKIEVQIRYPNRSDDWEAYHQGKIEDVDEDGNFLVKGIIEKNAEIRVRIITDNTLPSEWSSSFVTIDENETDELYVEKRYSVSYVMEYGGKRVSTTPDYTYENGLLAFDGSKYGISANEKWFAEQSGVLLKDKAAIVRYIIKGRAGNSNGDDAYVKDDKDNEILIAEIDADKFRDDPSGVAYSGISAEYNEITVYAVVASYATETDSTGGVYVSSPSPVRYTGLPHKLAADPAAQKNNANKSASFDLNLVIKDTSSTDENGEVYELVYGEDYTVKYKNEKNASMKYDPATGKYTSLYADESEAEKKSPQILVTGKGNYKDMKTTIFFDILPLSLWVDREAVGRFIDGGLEDSYVLGKNGGLKLSVKPVRRGRFYDSDIGAYVTDNDKPDSYSKGEILMTLQKQNELSGGWDTIGSLDGSEAKTTLKKVNTSGRYRVWYAGTGNFFGSGPEEQFDVFEYGTTRFSSLKAKTSKAKYKSGGVEASELVTGIKDKVKDKNGNKVSPEPADYEVTLTALSPTAKVENNKAMSAGIYTATIDWVAEYGKYEGIVIDGPIRTTVEVTGDKLKSSMITLDWDKKGVAYDGKSRSITVTLNGITPNDITLAKQIVSGRKKKYVPLDDEEFAKVVTVSADGKLTISGSYKLAGTAAFDDTAPGTYTIAFVGKGQYGGSVITEKIKRLPVALTSEMISAGTADFNISGIETEFYIASDALGISDYTEGKGDANYSVSYSGFKPDKTADASGRIGTVKATVKVKSEISGLKKGSSAKVEVDVYPASTDVFAYSEYSHDMQGKIFAQVSGDVAAGGKAPKLTLFQSSADGMKLKKIPAKYYTAEFAKETPVPGYEASAPSYDLKLTAGREKGFAFDENGSKLEGIYSEYKKKASKWGDIKFGNKASVICDNGDDMTYTDRSIEKYAYRTVDVDTTGKVPEVCYIGSSFILPVVDEIVVDGVTLKRADRDFIITYSKNNKAGTATMTITLTRGESDQTMTYPLGGSKSYKFKIRNQKNKGLKL